MKGATFNRLAERELGEAVQYYDIESPGLGQRFLDEVQTSLAILMSHPEIAPRIRGDIRRLTLRRDCDT